MKMKNTDKIINMVWNTGIHYADWKDKTNCEYMRDGDKIEYFYSTDPDYPGFIFNNHTENKFRDDIDNKLGEYLELFKNDCVTFFDTDKEAYTKTDLAKFNKKFKNIGFCKITANIESGKVDVKVNKITAETDIYGTWKYIDPKKRDEHGFIRENNVEFAMNPKVILNDYIKYHIDKKEVWVTTLKKVNELFDNNYQFPVVVNEFTITTACFKNDLNNVKAKVEAELKKIHEKKYAEKTAKFANLKPQTRKAIQTKLMKKIKNLKEELLKLENEYNMLNEF